MIPPPYPRIPHLIGGRGSRDDLVLTDREVDSLLHDQVVVEEKLDGANVTVFSDGTGLPQIALRGGTDSADRAGQRGPLRAWAAANLSVLEDVLEIFGTRP